MLSVDILRNTFESFLYDLIYGNNCNIDLWDANSLKLEAIHNYPQCRDMDFIIEMEENVEGDTHPWNMYLIKK